MICVENRRNEEVNFVQDRLTETFRNLARIERKVLT
jgi:hypothetical protein